MKTIKIIDIQKVCNGCKFNLPSLCDKSMQDIVSCEEGKEDASIIEQVPETWEELKELCRKLKLDSEVYITLQLTDKVKFYFYDNGEIIGAYTDYEYEFSLAKKKTPAQMYQIIKSLIGEE